MGGGQGSWVPQSTVIRNEDENRQEADLKYREDGAEMYKISTFQVS